MANDLNAIIQGLIDTDEGIISKIPPQLKSKIETLTSDASTAKSNITTLQNDVKTLKSDMSTAKSNITTLQNDTKTLKSDMATAKSDISTAKTNISTLQTQVSNKADNSYVNNCVSSLETKIKQGAGTYAIVDVNTTGRSGSGTVTADTAASQGQCLALTSTSSTTLLYQGKFAPVNFGYYALCARVRITSATTGNIVQLRVLNGSTQILSKNFTGAAFSSTSQYCYLYATFQYEGSTKNDLTFQLNTLNTSGIPVRFDYAYISMAIPSVFL